MDRSIQKYIQSIKGMCHTTAEHDKGKAQNVNFLWSLPYYAIVGFWLLFAPL